MSHLILLLTAAWAKKPPKNEPAPPPPALPSGDVDPAVAPRLTGPDSVLSLEGLSRDSVSFAFRVDTSALLDLDDDAIDAVFAELAADPNWRVTLDAGARVAWLRSPEDEYVVGVDGWRVASDRCSRIGVREGATIEPEWASSDRVVRVAAGKGGVEAHGFRPDGGVCAKLAVALRVEGDLTLEIFEASAAEQRPLARQALGDVPMAVLNTLAAADAIAADGFDPLGLPDKEPLRIAGPTITLAASGAGELLMRARVNPGEPGWTWLRVVTADGAAWHEAALARATLEAPGWSKDPTHGFYLQSTIPVPPGAALSATAELWFQGVDGDPRRLVAAPVTVPAR